jgi:hypothetical protein
MKDEDQEKANTSKTVNEQPPTIEGTTTGNAATGDTAKDKNVA